MAGKKTPYQMSRTWEEIFSQVLLKKLDTVCYHDCDVYNCVDVIPKVIICVSTYVCHCVLKDVNIVRGRVM